MLGNIKQEPRARRPTLDCQQPKSNKGHNSAKKPFRVMALGHSLALMMVYKCVKFHKAGLDSKKVMAKVKVSHDAADDQVMTIPRLFVPKQSS